MTDSDFTPSFRGGKGGGFRDAGTDSISISPSPSPFATCVSICFDELATLGGGDTDDIDESMAKLPLSFGDPGVGLSTSISVILCEVTSLVRFPSTVPVRSDEYDEDSVTPGLDGPSSTNVASVSLDESVPPVSISSSSSSREVTNASLASSTVGVTAAASQNSRLKNNSASWCMTISFRELGKENAKSFQYISWTVGFLYE